MDNASVDSKDEDDIAELERKIRYIPTNCLCTVLRLPYVTELQRCLNTL